ncbi:hypothetical protein GCK72_021745 [Caenorhabditis remanei]|uniref:F-box domain-containing protein n=1 Tax=Caenorhabditis remanei TaxID=31234 RepID=A0A6A5GKP3_CAERE|nr:hypothetical protein GCK72_021745 [Caenorhabditis remanei]KAF1755176.1 hypothetical protein GCK72_021745 [Caenorhabditis remanei]
MTRGCLTRFWSRFFGGKQTQQTVVKDVKSEATIDFVQDIAPSEPTTAPEEHLEPPQTHFWWFAPSDYTTTIMNMPDVAVARILEYLDFKEIFTLRKVNHGFRGFIDHSYPSLNLTNLHISATPQKIIMVYNLTTHVEYQLDRYGCIVIQGAKKTFLEDSSFLETFLEDLEYVLSRQKGILEALQLEWRTQSLILTPWDEQVNSIFNAFQQFLGARKKPLRVQKLLINAYTQHHVIALLRHFDPKFIKEIQIFVTCLDAREEVFELGELVKLESHWNNLERVVMRRKISQNDFHYFTKIREVSVIVQGVSLGSLVFLKETLTLSPTFRKFAVEIKCFRLPRRSLLDLYGPPNVEENERRSYYFRIPDDTMLLKMSIDPFDSVLSFFRIERAELPKFAYVQN